ncbi:hypothetical protein [Clostridium tertium]|uniref:Tubby C 2 n=1 Tax=Clostridium tertium TaxID=1559 RepID=A0A6N3G7W0_9CLOT
MRRLYVKERLIAFGAKFDIYDENENKVFIAEADKFDIGKNVSLYDLNKRKILYLKQKLRIGAHKYIAYDENMQEVAVIDKSFMNPEYNISGQYGNMVMESASIWGRHYEIKVAGTVVGRIDKEFTFGRDRYFLEVLDETYTTFFVGLLIMIDMVRFHSDN